MKTCTLFAAAALALSAGAMPAHGQTVRYYQLPARAAASAPPVTTGVEWLVPEDQV